MMLEMLNENMKLAMVEDVGDAQRGQDVQGSKREEGRYPSNGGEEHLVVVDGKIMLEMVVEKDGLGDG
jgi:hypothetical protein